MVLPDQHVHLVLSSHNHPEVLGIQLAGAKQVATYERRGREGGRAGGMSQKQFK